MWTMLNVQGTHRRVDTKADALHDRDFQTDGSTDAKRTLTYSLAHTSPRTPKPHIKRADARPEPL